MVYLDYYYYNQYYHFSTQGYADKTERVDVGSDKEGLREQKSPVKKVS